MSAVRRRAFFLDSTKGRRFALLTEPSGACRGALLYLHPFAEEMNKSRRMAALGARAFAEHGWTVLQLDHFGCGESSGDFSNVDWQDWIDDVEAGYEWLRADGHPAPALWSLRAGSLLASDWLARRGTGVALLLWQPVANGKQHLTQFLRLRAAADMAGDADARATIGRLRAEIGAGKTVEVAGYGISPALAAGLEGATLSLPAGFQGPVAVLEVVAGERTAPSPGLAASVAKWRDADVSVSLEVVPGAAFWQTQEIETVAPLIARSTHMLQGLLA